MADKAKPERVSLETEIQRLRSDLSLIKTDIKFMRAVGGFADSKTLSKRCTRIEDRIEKLELGVQLVEGIAPLLLAWSKEALKEPHHIEHARKASRYLREHAERSAAIGKQDRSRAVSA